MKKPVLAFSILVWSTILWGNALSPASGSSFARRAVGLSGCAACNNTHDPLPAGASMKTVQDFVDAGGDLSYLGRREPKLYGITSASELDSMLRAYAEKRGYDREIFYVDEHFDGGSNGPRRFTYAEYALSTLTMPCRLGLNSLQTRCLRDIT